MLTDVVVAHCELHPKPQVSADDGLVVQPPEHDTERLVGTLHSDLHPLALAAALVPELGLDVVSQLEPRHLRASCALLPSYENIGASESPE